MPTRMLRAAVVALLVAVALAAPRRAAAQGFTLIVNAANTASSVSRDEAAMIFLKQKLTWSNGQRALPVDLAKASTARAAFSKQILGRSVSGVTSYWQGQIFAGGAQPPAEKASDADIVAFVRANPNAVGYVSAGTALPDGVKSLALR
jgi:ABC-type phosphate transport system substrate-binding protein